MIPNQPPQVYVAAPPTVAYVSYVSNGNEICYGEIPVRIRCQFCGQEVTTITNREIGLLNWVACGGLALVGCVMGCCLIPFCIDDLKDVSHICPQCHHLVGVKKRLN